MIKKLVLVVLGVLLLGAALYIYLPKNDKEFLETSIVETVEQDEVKEPLSFFKKKEEEMMKKPREICLMGEGYEAELDNNEPILSIPFKIEDYSTKYWGVVPFCAKLRNGQVHGALDFELKPDTEVLSATDGVVTRVEVGKREGSGEVIQIRGDGFSLDYSGLTNLQFKVGERVKKGEYIANAVQIPHGEYHVHMGLIMNGRQVCPLKYMDEEFFTAFEKMFAEANYESQTNAKCACDCDVVEMIY